MVDDENSKNPNNVMKAWEEFLQKTEGKLGKNTVDRWIRPLRINKFDARNLYLESSDPSQITWFEEHIRPDLKNGLFNNNEKPIQVHLFLNQGKENGSKATPESAKSSYVINSDRLDPELTFENFISSPQNMVAYKLLNLPTLEFNPIYIYGPRHSGKTHLLTSAALHLQAKGKKVFYVRAETFTSHVVQAIRLGHMLQFRSVYRNIDALFVDNVDFFSKKDATQEEFFHTFNVLHTSGKQVILSANCPPSKLTDIEQRLMSRFEWGISIGIESVDPRLILDKKAALWNASYSSDLLDYLAKKFPKNPLIALQALLFRTKGISSLTPEKAAPFLQDLTIQEEISVLTPDKIAQETANHFGIRKEDILGKAQAREYAYPRQIAMFICREKLKLPFQKIGEIFGRDHSTVMSSVKQIQKGYDEKIGSLISDLKSIDQNCL